jgi:TPR repeat protein
MNIEKLIIKANKGNIKAIRDLANRYYFGDKKKAQSTAVIPKDANKAFEWWKVGADMGDESCLTNLGYCYHIGDGVNQDNIEAKRCWEQAAKKGSNGAFYNLAVLYANGWGVSKDSNKAIKYYKKNINKKNDYYDMSLLALARHYFEGLGTNKNIKKGINLYEQAAKFGNLRAMFELAHMFDEYNSYERYNMIKKNNDLAIKYYIQLAKNNYIFGHYAAMQIIYEEIKKLKNVKRNVKKFNLVIRLLKKYNENIKKNDEEFENKSAKMNFTREQIVKQRKSYDDLREKSLIYISKIKEISLNEK